MKIEHKAIALFGLIQLVVEYLEEIMADERFSRMFIRELKRDSKNFIKSSDKFISYIAANSDGELSDEIVHVYQVISRLVEEHIEWEQKKETVS
jgi:hypothetical protein